MPTRCLTNWTVMLLASGTILWLACMPAHGQAKFVRETDGPGLIERVYIRRGASHDPGAIVALLRNSSDAAARIDQIVINGHRLRQWPTAEHPVVWHRLTRDRLAPGQTSLLFAKLMRPLNGMIRLSVHGGGEPEQVLFSGEAVEPVRVVALRNGPAGKWVNLFVRNSCGSDQRLKSVLIDGQSIWSSGDHGKPLPAGALTRIGLTLEEPLEAGRLLPLSLKLADRRIALAARVSPAVLPAVDGFRLSIESGHEAMGERIGADPLVLESFRFEQRSDEDEADLPGGIESLAERQGEHWSMVRVSHGRFVSKQESDLACVFACPTHATDSYQTAAHLGMLAQRQLEAHAPYQSFIHACRTQPLEGIAIFGPIADAVRFNGQLTTAATADHPHRDRMPWTVYTLTRYAARVAGPSIALPMIPLERDRSLFKGRAPLAVEARQMVYAAMAAGAGGVAYRVMPQDWRDEQRDRMLDEVVEVNQEIRQVRDLLALGFPRELVSVDDPWIQAVCLDARPLGLVVLLINHDLRRSPPEMPPSVTPRGHEGVTLSLDLPARFEPGLVQSIEGDQAREIEAFAIAEGRASLTFDMNEATRMWVIRPE